MSIESSGWSKSLIKKSSVMNSRISRNGWGWPFPWPFPVVTFGSRVFNSSGALHTFNEADFRFVSENTKPDIIIQNGFLAEHNDYFLMFSFKENLVIFKNSQNEVDNISLDNLSKLLSGEVRNWKELDGMNEEVMVFRFSPPSKGNSHEYSKVVNYKHQLSLSKVSPNMDGIAEVDSYKELSALGKKYKGSLVIGLRQEKISSLSILDIDSSISNGNEYPLGCNVNILCRKKLNNENHIKKYLRSMKKNMKRDEKNILKPLVKAGFR